MSVCLHVCKCITCIWHLGKSEDFDPLELKLKMIVRILRKDRKYLTAAFLFFETGSHCKLWLV